MKLESTAASTGHFEFDSSGDGSKAYYFKSGQTTSSNPLLFLDRHDDSDASDIRMIQFEVGNQGRGYAVAGDGDSDTPNFAAGSDRRLKKNITDYTGGIDIIKAIKIRKFDEEYTSKTDIVGWVADEVKPTLPQAIGGGASNTATRTVTNAVVDENGRLVRENTTAQWLADEKAAGRRSNSVFHDSVSVPDYQIIMPQKMFPYVFAALKESIAKIEALEARVTTLEG